MAAGTPVIATALEGNLEQISDGVEGFLVPPGNPAAMAEKIALILTNHPLHQRLRAQALLKAHTFSWQRMVDRYIQNYERVLAQIPAH